MFYAQIYKMLPYVMMVKLYDLKRINSVTKTLVVSWTIIYNFPHTTKIFYYFIRWFCSQYNVLVPTVSQQCILLPVIYSASNIIFLSQIGETLGHFPVSRLNCPRLSVSSWSRVKISTWSCLGLVSLCLKESVSSRSRLGC